MIIKKRNITLKLIITGVVVILIMAFIHTDTKTIRSKLSYRNYESKLLNSYHNYIDDINLPGITLTSAPEDFNVFENPAKIKNLHKENAIQFFPVTLWQIYTLNGNKDWEELAEKYSRLLIGGQTPYMKGEDILQGELLNSYLSRSNQILKEEILSEFLSGFSRKKNSYQDSISRTQCTISYERLLNNQLLLFATKETGDPYYRHLAIETTENIFNKHFLNNRKNEIFFGISNWQRLPTLSELAELSSQDFYHLSISFYALTLFEQETGILKYNALTRKMMDIYYDIFKETLPKNNSAIPHREIILSNIDPLSKVFVCLAIDNMQCDSKINRQKFAKDLFYSVVNDLENLKVVDNQKYNFRTFYYLFNYIIQQEF